ncbi:adhesion G-protein coupled receptor F1-like [Symphorus nematophorus]
MAISKNGLTAFALLVTLIILETGNINDFSQLALPERHEEEHFLPHTREKRSALTGQWTYIIEVVVNTSNVETFEQIRSSLNAISFPVQFDNNTDISDVNITTVCASNGTGLQCRCEDQFAWPYTTCVSYGACDSISSGICKCINGIPADGQSCQPISALLAQVEYTVDVELNLTDVQTVDYLRSLLNNGSFSLVLGPTVNVTDIDITTVCYPNGTSFQCRCEDQYVWSKGNCLKHGACDEMTGDTCGCINSLPSNGEYCQPKQAPPILYEYLISVELNVSDVALINQLRSTLSNISYPVNITSNIQLSDVNISTVCSPSSGGFQCRCEDRYRWSCDQCLRYEACDSITDDTCGCINAIPSDGQYCQSADQYTPAVLYEYLISVELNVSDVAVVNQLRSTLSNISYPINITSQIQLSEVNISTAPAVLYEYLISVELNVSDVAVVNQLRSTLSNISYPINITSQIQLSEVNISTAPAVLYEYLISVELNVSDVAVVNQLRSTLSNISYPINITSQIQLSEVNISTVCSPSSGGFQCRCEDRYRWSCDQCLRYEACDNIIDDTCGCINAIPSDGQYCQSADQYTPAVLYEYLVSVELNVSDVAVINQLRSTLSNITYPIRINSQLEEQYKGITGFIRVFVEKFRPGSILVDFVVQTTQVIPAEMEEANKGLPEAMKPVAPVLGTVTASYRSPTAVSVPVRTFTGKTMELKCGPPENIDVGEISGSEWKFNGLKITGQRFTITNSGKSSTLKIKNVISADAEVKCNDAVYGAGQVNSKSSIGCDEGQEGTKTAVCQENGEWKLEEDTCIIIHIKELLIQSQDLVEARVAVFVANLSQTVQTNKTEIANSSATVSAIVDILNNIANITTDVDQSVMEDVLETVDVIIGDDVRESWELLNANETRNASSQLLGSLETLSNKLDGEFTIRTQRILLNRTTFDNNFTADLNSSIILHIPDTNINNVFITTITFSSLNNVMPARNASFDAGLFNATSNETVIDNAINAAVVLVQVNATIRNVTLSYAKLNDSLSINPQCVFWNFTLFDDLGAWDDEGCTFVSDINNTVTCSCNHLTSFSLLMATDIPPALREALDIITYVGVGISLASLVICLIIEGYVWKAITRNSTAFMRHVSIINTALSLLIADICFIIGAAIAKNPRENPGEDYEVPVGPCSTATFFMHFFYLALFFWMLVSGLLLFYRTVMVFSHMSKSTMLAIGFTLGYGCPLIIAVITVAVTAPGGGYIRKHDACWLNWDETKALLAMVIPALTIVFINILIVIVVLFKMLRRGVGDAAQTDEKHTLVVIARCVVILTPLFGLTWSLGVGTMIASTAADKGKGPGIHIAFAFFNSLQGFFILVFGTLFDSKIRSILSRKLPTTSTGSSQTRSTSGGISSLSGLNWIGRLRGRRYIYRVSEAANSSSTGASESFINI